MTPEQIRSVRISRGYSKAEWRRLLGISPDRLEYLEEPVRSITRWGPNKALQTVPKWLPFAYGWINYMGADLVPGFDPTERLKEWRRSEGATFNEVGLMLNDSTATLWYWNTGRRQYPNWFPYAVLWLVFNGERNPFAALTDEERLFAA